MRNTLPKKERIHKKEEIDFFFNKGKHFIEKPFRVIHYSKELPNDSSPCLNVMVSVPKKIFKKAVNRNSIKRKIKEAYRINNNALKEELNKNKKPVYILLIYTSNDSLNFKDIEDKIILILQRLLGIYAKDNQ